MFKKNRKIAGIVKAVMLFLLLFAGQSFAEEFGWPVPGHTSLTTIYKYSNGAWHSCRYWYPNKDTGKPAGIDIAVSTGTEILAPASGTVQKIGWQPDGFGNHFEIKHDNGTITLYAHLSEYRVENGQRVNRGDVIALSGSTGNSTGPHLHYEMSDRVRISTTRLTATETPARCHRMTATRGIRLWIMRGRYTTSSGMQTSRY